MYTFIAKNVKARKYFAISPYSYEFALTANRHSAVEYDAEYQLISAIEEAGFNINDFVLEKYENEEIGRRSYRFDRSKLLSDLYPVDKSVTSQYI
jgi:hypothetical protein